MHKLSEWCLNGSATANVAKVQHKIMLVLRVNVTTGLYRLYILYSHLLAHRHPSYTSKDCPDPQGFLSATADSTPRYKDSNKPKKPSQALFRDAHTPFLQSAPQDMI